MCRQERRKKKGRSVVEFETSADADGGWTVNWPSQCSDGLLKTVLLVLGYEKRHKSLLQGACLGLTVNQTNLIFPLSSNSFSIMHSQTLYLQLT